MDMWEQPKQVWMNCINGDMNKIKREKCTYCTDPT